jgi:hypothetical protein
LGERELNSEERKALRAVSGLRIKEQELFSFGVKMNPRQNIPLLTKTFDSALLLF